MESTHSYSDFDDAELVRLWLKGEEIAFVALYKRYLLRLLNNALQKTNSKEIARELVQEVFMELYLHRHSLVPGTCLQGYLFTILRNKVFNYYRRQTVDQKYQDHIRLLGELSDSSANEAVEKKELKEKINSIVQSLPTQCKTVFLLKRDEHFSNKEIARRLNISVNTVEQHIRKARNVLRKKLGKW